jgi:hypothetical protein
MAARFLLGAALMSHRVVLGFAVVAALAVGCGQGENSSDNLECGPGGLCPAGLQCDPATNRCYQRGTSPDAPVAVDASVIDAATPDAAVVDVPVVDTVILTSPAPVVAATGARFTFSGAGATSFVCAVDDQTPAACVSPVDVTVAEGQHTFTVAAVGDATPAVATWTVDVTPPDTTVDGPSGTVATTDATFALGATEPATFECSLDSQPFAACTSPAHFSGLAAGDHHLAARAIDAAGNVDPIPAEAHWTIDVTGPIITVDGTPADQATTSDPHGHFTFTFVDPTEANGGTFECAIDGAATAPCTSPADVTFAADGTHVFGVRGRDRVGNPGPLVQRSFTLDRAAPAVHITGAPAEGALTSQRQIALVPSFVDASEPGKGSTLTCKLDNAPFTTDACVTGAAAIIATDGAHTFTVKGRDVAGNEAQAVRTWTLDTVPPTATLTGPPTNGSVTSSRSTSFTFSLDAGAGPGAITQCRLVGPGVNEAFAAAGCANRTNLADGAYQFSVRGVDAAGNPGGPATIGWTIDTQGPAVAWLASSTPADGATTTSPNVSYAWTFANPVDAPGGQLQFSLDGTTWTAGSTFVGTFTTQGTNTFRARGIDAAGNIGPTLARTMILDNVPPVVVLGGTPANNGATNVATAFTFAFNPAEPATSVLECSTDGAPFAAAACVNRTYPDGQHTLVLRGHDAAGNPSAPKTVAFTFDTVQPTASFNFSDPPNGSVSNKTNWRYVAISNESPVTFQCTLDGTIALPALCDGSVTVMTQGVHSIVARAVDAAGNVGPPSAPISFTLDSLGPTINVLTKPVNHRTQGIANFSWTSTDAHGPVTYACHFFSTPVNCVDGNLSIAEAIGTNQVEIIATDAVQNNTVLDIFWTVGN